MNRLSKLRGRRADGRSIDFDEWLGMFNFDGLDYPLSLVSQSFPGGKTQEIRPTLSGLANGALRGNGVIHACVTTRNWLFSEAVFQFRPLGSITSSDLYGKPQLEPLEAPWPGGTTRKLLSLFDLYVQLTGNGYVYRDPNLPGTLRVPRPDWMSIVLGSRNDRPDFRTWDIDTEVLGYIYRPGGDASQSDSVPLLREQVAHFMPDPDPDWQFRGRSWLQPIIKEIQADVGMNEHKLKFLENGATPNLVVTLDPAVRKEEFESWVEKFDAGHKGAINAYKTIYLAGGADAKVVGADLKQLDFRTVQAHGETRICIAAGIPAILVGVSEGLDSATYSNYGQAKRSYGDMKLRPLWAGACAELGQLVTVPADSELWYDERRIAFLREDMKDQATIMQMQAATIRSLTDAGWTPESAAAYVESGDLTKLLHTGLFSVQLQPPGSPAPAPQFGQVPTEPNPPAPPPGQAAPAEPAAMIVCSLCHEPAASNATRCGKCAELNRALRVTPALTAERIAHQLGITEQRAGVALGVTKEAPPRLIVRGEPKDHLTPVPNGNGRLA